MSAVLRGNLRMALSSIKNAKWRSFLTMLGIIVGVAAVVTVVGIGEGVKRQIAGALNEFGEDLIIVRPGQEEASGISFGQSDVVFGMSSAMNLTLNDAETIKQTEGVRLSAPLGVVPGSVSVNGEESKIKVLSAGADLPQLLNQDLKYGGFWQPNEEEANLVVLGEKAAFALFDEPVPLGKSFSFRGEDFQVRGIFDAFDEVPFSPTATFDNVVFIPHKTAERLTGGTAVPYAVLAKPHDPNSVRDVMSGIESSLSEARGGDSDFAVLGSGESAQASDDFVSLLSMWILAVAAVCLLMGGVGIMNIMLLVVTERMHEIGVRKAVGANARQILGQFVLEAAVLSVVGGAIGVVVASGVIGMLHLYTDLRPVISWPAIGIAAGVSVAIGVVFGSIPAIKAAAKDPIEALRHE